MNVLYPKALTLLRVVAVSLILPGSLVLAAYVLHARRDHQPVQVLHCLSLSIPLVMGVVILLKSQAWARRLTQDFDE